MLPRQARLRSRAEFAETTRLGRRAGVPGLVVYLRAADGAGPTRAGFIVSRAVGPAVVRNRVRRRLRHLVAARLERLPAGAQLVVRATPPAAGEDSAALAHQFDRALERLLTPAPVR